MAVALGVRGRRDALLMVSVAGGMLPQPLHLETPQTQAPWATDVEERVK